MGNRWGEKIGWTAGWLGGFIWVAILSVVFLIQGNYAAGVIGLIVTGCAVAAIVLFSPWRHPTTPYWKLLLAPYSVFLLSIVWAIVSYGGLAASGLRWWNLFWLLPLLVPLGPLARRKWSDADGPKLSSRDDTSV